MMRICKIILLSYFFTTLPTALPAQAMQSYVWPMGYGFSEPHPDFGGMLLNFGTNEVNVERFEIEFEMFGSTMYCSDNGDLNLYTNGCNIYGNNHQVIENGDSLSYTPLWGLCPELSYITLQGTMFLSWPDKPDKAALFHIRRLDYTDSSEILITTLEKSDKTWSVSDKNTVVYRSAQQMEYVSATRHANGRDWWILVSEEYSKEIVTCLFTAQGVISTFPQELIPGVSAQWSSGQSCFSTDGSKFIRYFTVNGLYIYDFDRCSGVLSNLRFVAPTEDYRPGGCATSKDSRFLYVTQRDFVYQYDLHEPDILASREVVGVYDGYLDPFPTSFFQAALAPDGKIYISSTNSVSSMHVIRHPERKGIACDLRQHDLELPVLNTYTVPNFPNYRLGPVDGSPCDTLGINNIPIAEFRYTYDTNYDQRIEFRNTSAFEPTDFYWTYGDGHASIAFEQEHTYSHSGIYEACLTASNKYGTDTFCREIEIEVDSNDHVPSIPELLITPNPVSEFLHIRTAQKLDHPLEIRLYDIHGKECGVFLLGTGLFDHFIDITTFPAGVYVYHAEFQNEQRISGKLIKV